MEVLALIESRDHVCYRYRIEAFGAALARRGCRLRPLALARSSLSRTPQILRLRRHNTVILQRRLLPGWHLHILRRAAGRLVFDLDDAVFQRDSFHRKGPHSRRRRARFEATVRAADMVTVGNEYLRQEALRYVAADRVQVIPTCVDPGLYRPADQARSGEGLRLAWIGSSSTLVGLEQIQTHLRMATERVAGLELHTICDRGVELAGVTTLLRHWSAQTEAADLADCDVGIGWLPDDSWSRGKCGLKVLQYMAAGLPVVANPVGTNPEMVIPGVTGFLATTPGEWTEALQLLAADRGLRHKLGMAGRRLVEDHYAVAQWEEPFAAAVIPDENLADTGPQPSGQPSVKRPAWIRREPSAKRTSQ